MSQKWISSEVISHLMKHTIRGGRDERAGKFYRESLKGKTEEEKGEKSKRQNGHMACQTSPLFLGLVPAPDTIKYVGVFWEVIWLVLNKWQSHTHIQPEESKYSVISTVRSWRMELRVIQLVSSHVGDLNIAIDKKKKKNWGNHLHRRGHRDWFVLFMNHICIRHRQNRLIATPSSLSLPLSPSCARERIKWGEKSKNQ